MNTIKNHFPNPIVKLSFQFPFNFVHKLETANEKEFHGHSASLILTFHGAINPQSGLSLSRDRIKSRFEEIIILQWKGQILNTFMKWCSCEWIAKEIFENLKKDSLFDSLVCVTIKETGKNTLCYPFDFIITQ